MKKKILPIITLLVVLASSCGNSTNTSSSFSSISSEVITSNNEETSSEQPNEIKNIIYLIPDGAGWGSYDLAYEVKKANSTGVIGARTKTSTNAIEGEIVTGLYLDDYLVGSLNTLLANPYKNSYITDSAAAGTALSSGYKTNYLHVGVDENLIPKANIIESSKLSGKATGIVTTKSWVDATPATFLAHSNSRYNQDDLSYQALMSDIDILLAYGSESGVYTKDGYLHDLSASKLGYTIVNNPEEMNEKIFVDKETKVWSNFLEGKNNASYGRVGYDYSANHISYDYNADVDELSLLDMAKAAHFLLSENINDEDGFFLMVEGGAIDNAAETCIARDAVAEYLAFDETFAFFVNWAMSRDDTIVIAAPDHDSGGFIVNNLENAVNSIINNEPVDTNFVKAGRLGHTAQEVPFWLYAPSWVRDNLLEELGLPVDVKPEDVRTGRFYDGTIVNELYTINNFVLPHAIIKKANMISLEEATEILFANATSYGNYDAETDSFIFNNGERVIRNKNYWLDSSNTKHYFTFGRGTYIIDTIDESANSFYVPIEFLVNQGYLNA